jgi:hypothetical protein
MGAEFALIVGVTGHRPNRLQIGEVEVARRLWWVLASVKSGAHGRDYVALTALAEGSDRLFAQAALDLDYQLEVLLPFQGADYETTFGDASTKSVYRDLLARAVRVTELPGSLDDSKAAYEAVGHATVAASSIVVAVWDGKGAAGRGGTLEIMEHALNSGKPVIWVDAARLSLPRLLAQPTGHGRRTLTLDLIKSRTKPLTRAGLSLLMRQVALRLTS